MKDFIQHFFEARNCKVQDVKNRLLVELTPELQTEFRSEKLHLAFTSKSLTENSELVTHGSYIPTKILSILSEEGQKVVGKLPSQNTLSKKAFQESLSTKSSEIKKLTRTTKLNYELIFNFKATFVSDEKFDELYSVKLFEEKAKVSKIEFVKNEKVEELTHRDSGVISEAEIEAKLFFATETLQNYLTKRTSEIEKEVLKRLYENLKRLKSYYGEQIAAFRRSSVPGTDEKAEFIEMELKKKKIEEVKNHSLKVELQLISFQLLERKVYHFDFHLKSSTLEKNISASFDTFNGKLTYPTCEGCGEQTSKIELCDSKHLLCPNCLSVCEKCGEMACRSCGVETCSVSGEILCQNCQKICDSCGQATCDNHSHFSQEENELICENCLIVCKNCQSKVSIDHAGGCSVSNESFFCENCLNVCSKCQKQYLKNYEKECTHCGQIYCEDCSQKCFYCERNNCQSHLSNCNICAKSLCKNHSHQCSMSNSTLCKEHSKQCNGCGKEFRETFVTELGNLDLHYCNTCSENINFQEAKEPPKEFSEKKIRDSNTKWYFLKGIINDVWISKGGELIYYKRTNH
ncbi:MAG: hypothetical protein DWQ06_03315 [Calditrichaeota bacterium]|nr:MAG: hypothetical protein DWQ06_03315 [Calditrichota bacterium]